MFEILRGDKNGFIGYLIHYEKKNSYVIRWGGNECINHLWKYFLFSFIGGILVLLQNVYLY